MKNVSEIFWRFLALGCVSFGGPAAHIGYFHRVFVEQQRWLDDAAYARLVALSQFLPGPASSQVGFALGLKRGGLWGGLAAFAGFTLPSFLLMYALSLAHGAGVGEQWFAAAVHGLKLFAVVVVADATLSMHRKFCTDAVATGVAVGTMVGVLCLPGTLYQLLFLGAAAVFGIVYKPGLNGDGERAGSGIVYSPLVLFAVLFVLTPFAGSLGAAPDLFARFFQAGSLVFGGGHVVLPLLQNSLGGMVPTDEFLLGYAGAQAVPGPMFSLAAYLGAEVWATRPLGGAVLATAGVFLPGFLLVVGLQGAWEALARRPAIDGAVWAINAAVVGLLLAVLYQPVFVNAVTTPVDFAAAVLGFFLLRSAGTPVVVLVVGFAVFGLMSGLAGA